MGKEDIFLHVILVTLLLLRILEMMEPAVMSDVVLFTMVTKLLLVYTAPITSSYHLMSFIIPLTLVLNWEAVAIH